MGGHRHPRRVGAKYSILTRIAQTLGIRTTGAVHVIEANIVERVRETRGLLVIDEAQHLTHRALDAVRSIHDAAGIGLAWSATRSCTAS